MPSSERVLLLGYEHERINPKTSSSVPCASDSASGKRSKNGGVIIFTRLSVHWADNITATSNS